MECLSGGYYSNFLLKARLAARSGQAVPVYVQSGLEKVQGWRQHNLHCWSVLMKKLLFLLFSLNQSCFIRHLLSHTIPLCTAVKSLSLYPPSPLHKNWGAAVRSPHGRLYYKLHKPSSLKLFLQGK